MENEQDVTLIITLKAHLTDANLTAISRINAMVQQKFTEQEYIHADRNANPNSRG